jgi:hypothetical protein
LCARDGEEVIGNGTCAAKLQQYGTEHELSSRTVMRDRDRIVTRDDLCTDSSCASEALIVWGRHALSVTAVATGNVDLNPV